MDIRFPEGKFLGLVKVGEKGQIVIPKGARDLFSIKPGDQLLLLADRKRGIALADGSLISGDMQKLWKLAEGMGDGRTED